jgi:hypothetical protein
MYSVCIYSRSSRGELLINLYDKDLSIRIVDVVFRCKYNLFTLDEITIGVEQEYRSQYVVFKSCMPENVKFVEENLEQLVNNNNSPT